MECTSPLLSLDVSSLVNSNTSYPSPTPHNSFNMSLGTFDANNANNLPELEKQMAVKCSYHEEGAPAASPNAFR